MIQYLVNKQHLLDAGYQNLTGLRIALVREVHKQTGQTHAVSIRYFSDQRDYDVSIRFAAPEIEPAIMAAWDACYGRDWSEWDDDELDSWDPYWLGS